MKVKELIEELCKFDPEMDVVVEVGVGNLDYPTALTSVEKAWWNDHYCHSYDPEDEDLKDPETCECLSFPGEDGPFVLKLSGIQWC